MSRQQRTMPTRHAVARYWLERKEAPWSSHGWDYGEPACMACSWWKEEWDEESTIPQKWAASGLNRCHIVPRYMGGSDLCENLVLMCDVCHSGQPDSLDPLETFAYMRSIPGRMAAGFAELLASHAATKAGA